MPDRSEESLEEELGMLDDESSESGGASDAGDASGDVDLDSLEAELGMGDDATGDVGLDQDPSDQYGDLLGDAPAADSGASTTDEADDSGGFLSGLFGGSESESAESAAANAGPTTESSVDAGGVLDDVDTGPSTDAAPASAGESQTAQSRRSRLAGFFSLRAFLAATLAVAVLAGIGGTFLPIPFVGGPAGILAGAFLVGAASGQSRYLEAAVAGVLVGAIGTFAGGLSVAFVAGATTRLLAVGGVGGLLLALIGAYFGNDLRAGLLGGEDWSEKEL